MPSTMVLIIVHVVTNRSFSQWFHENAQQATLFAPSNTIETERVVQFQHKQYFTDIFITDNHNDNRSSDLVAIIKKFVLVTSLLLASFEKYLTDRVQWRRQRSVAVLPQVQRQSLRAALWFQPRGSAWLSYVWPSVGPTHCPVAWKRMQSLVFHLWDPFINLSKKFQAVAIYKIQAVVNI